MNMYSIRLLEPHNRQNLCTYTPVFSFQMEQKIDDVCYKIQVDDNPAFSSPLEYSQIANVIRPVLMCHCDGPGGGMAFTDSSPSGNVIFNFNSVLHDVSDKAMGTASARSALGSRYLYVTDDFEFNFDIAPFTIESWVKGSTIGGGMDSRIYMKHELAPVNYGLELKMLGSPKGAVKLEIWHNAVNVVSIVTTDPEYFVKDVWGHVAVCRDANKIIRLFVKGKMIGQAPCNFDFDPPGGSNEVFGESNIQMEMRTDEIRVIKGVARYTKDFIPFTTPFENDYLPLGNPSEWSQYKFGSMDLASFIPPYSRKISPGGKWYWRVLAYPGDYQDTILATSETREFTIAGAAYKWQVGLEGSEVSFRPSNTTVTTETVKYGRMRVEKKKFTVVFAPMNETQRNLLYAEFARKRVLKFHDNTGGIYNVYWGDVERSLNGTAHPPSKEQFGIIATNLVGGARRFAGTAVFSEA